MPRIVSSLALSALLAFISLVDASAEPAPTGGHNRQATTSAASSKLIVPPPAVLAEPQRGAAWTQEKWDETSREWQKQPQWAACQKEASDQKLEGSDTWTVIAVCMNRAK